jgi:uncharacterized protein YcfL
MKRIISPLAILALLAGCQGGPYAPKAERRPGVSEATVTIVLLDRAVQASVTAEGDRSTTLPDGRLHVQANLRNRESRRIVVQVQCVFKDEQGFSTGDETPWTTLIMPENATEAVEFKSLGTTARKYTVRVKQSP